LIFPEIVNYTPEAFNYLSETVNYLSEAFNYLSEIYDWFRELVALTAPAKDYVPEYVNRNSAGISRGMEYFGNYSTSALVARLLPLAA
jgi:hypothetical protein